MSNISELRMLRSHFPLAVLAVAALGCQQTSVRPGSTASAPAQENGSSQPEGVEGPFIEEGDTYEVPQEGPATDCPDAGACDQGAQTLATGIRPRDRHARMQCSSLGASASGLAALGAKQIDGSAHMLIATQKNIEQLNHLIPQTTQ